jgi:hypothetical protein
MSARRRFLRILCSCLDYVLVLENLLRHDGLQDHPLISLSIYVQSLLPLARC